MVKLTFTKHEMTDEERELVVLINRDITLDKIVDALYPPANRDSKGYIELVNFLYKGEK